jgi:hypothetical protein
MQGRRHSEETKKRMSESQKGHLVSEEQKRKISQAHKGKHNSEESIKKWLKSCGTKPNKAELKLNEILQGITSNKYSLNVMGDILILGGKIPDFVNVDGEKKIIELWGDFWHRGQNPQDRIDYFKRFGWDSCIIWEHELTQPEALKEKITNFVNSEKK